MRLPNRIFGIKLIGLLANIILVTSTLGCINISISDTNNSSSNPNEQMISKSSEPNITFVTTGSSFSPIITVTGNPTIQWIFGDGSTSNTTSPTVNFSSNGTRVNTLIITPWSAVTKINVGYNRGDGGAVRTADLLDPQYVSAVYGLENVAPYLQVFCASNRGAGTNESTISSINFSNFTQLQYVECYYLSSLTNVTLYNNSNVKRLCFEGTSINYLDLSHVPNLEDFRGANLYTTGQVIYNWGNFVYPKTYHICIGNNPRVSTNLNVSNFPNLKELLIWNDNMPGVLNPISTQLDTIWASGNHFTSSNLYGLLNHSNYNSTLKLDNNDLKSINIFNNSGLTYVDLQNNILNQTMIDNVLYALDLAARTSGYLDISSNTYPSSTGMRYLQNLRNKNWTVIYDEPPKSNTSTGN